MAEIGKALTGYVVGVIVLAFAVLSASAERIANDATSDDFESGLFKLLLYKAKMHYQHFWPDLELGWRVIVGSVIGFFAVVFGSLGDDRGDGIFVPMLILIIGFDPKTSTAISVCMITGVSVGTVLLSHPIIEHPIIDSDLVLLLTPMLLLGISIGVVLNVIFAEWMVIVMLIVLIIVTSTRAFFKGVEVWKEENRMDKYWNTEPYEEEDENEDSGAEDIMYKLLPRGPRIRNEEVITFIVVAINLLDYLHGQCLIFHKQTLPQVILNLMCLSLYWNADFLSFSRSCIRRISAYLLLCGSFSSFCILLRFIALNCFSTYTSTCSTIYWILNLLQVLAAVGVSAYEAVCLYNGTRVVMSSGKEVITVYMGNRVVMSSGEEVITWKVHQLILYCCCGFLAGIVGGLLGLHGGFILVPLFLQLGILPQVSSTTANFMMIFSSSMSVIQYYLLGHFPVPYALYFVAVTTVAALVGRHVIDEIIRTVNRVSVIIFVLAFTIFVGSVSLGGVGIADAIKRIKEGQYMGFDNICAYKP
ncbi:sulfite exporter TauE/SafE family protein 3-like [Solanum stenotomum]|uniref:sulfite exporter TauE/SafE family protein 3-like n=1 Tax=Solanum stenotomum TaxID=172797 RepID=UPI0020D03C0A|nr:sulfite exporter TauE/SafE family protein 3-like [Solanum stenotomum]